MGGPTGWSTTSKQLRGYGAEWDIKRRRVLHRDGYRCKCSHCAAAGKLLIASEVDHIVSRAKARAMGWSPERIEAEENLQAINSECHKRKTIEERGASYRPQRRVGPDGFPL